MKKLITICLLCMLFSCTKTNVKEQPNPEPKPVVPENYTEEQYIEDYDDCMQACMDTCLSHKEEFGETPKLYKLSCGIHAKITADCGCYGAKLPEPGL